MNPEFKPLEKCQDRELVRLKWNEGTAWAVVLVRKEFYSLLVFRDDLSAVLYFLHEDNVPIMSFNYRNKTVYSYGSEWSIEVDHHNGCQIIESNPSREYSITSSSLIRTTDNGFDKADTQTYISAAKERGGEAYVNAGNCEITGGFYNTLAVFENWKISVGQQTLIRRGDW